MTYSEAKMSFFRTTAALLLAAASTLATGCQAPEGAEEVAILEDGPSDDGKTDNITSWRMTVRVLSDAPVRGRSTEGVSRITAVDLSSPKSLTVEADRVMWSRRYHEDIDISLGGISNAFLLYMRSNASSAWQQIAGVPVTKTRFLRSPLSAKGSYFDHAVVKGNQIQVTTLNGYTGVFESPALANDVQLAILAIPGNSWGDFYAGEEFDYSADVTCGDDSQCYYDSRR